MLMIVWKLDAICAYYHCCCESDSGSWQGVHDTTLYDKSKLLIKWN